MPEKKDLRIGELSLNLQNLRTVRQENELDAVRAMISTSPDYFWALTHSLLESGLLPTENVIVLRGAGSHLSVREGNRRIAALKLIHGLIPSDDLNVPAETKRAIAAVQKEWIEENKIASCVIYGAQEAAVVARIVRLAHGKGDKAGRDQWNAVARARHNRDELGNSEPGLDLLEKYLSEGRNVTDSQALRWAGVYPLSVLDEAMKRVAPRLGIKGSPALAAAYPAVLLREPLERLIHDIGHQDVTFTDLRRSDADILSEKYGIESQNPRGSDHSKGSSGASGGSSGSGATKPTTSGKAARRPTLRPKSVAINDPKSAIRALKSFEPRGPHREKVVALKMEASLLNIEKTPMAFCFLLRSMFELSARAYIADHKPQLGSLLKRDEGKKDASLADLLKGITKHLVGTGAGRDKDKEREIHGASTELQSKSGFLSVHSMNQLVHNQSFSLVASHIATMFGNVFPLLKAMNS